MKWLTLLLLILSSLSLFGQRSKKVKSEYIFNAPSNVSPDRAKEIALQRAQIQVIAEEYGTTISQNNYTSVVNSTSGSSINFKSIGTSEVKGEWIETIGEPKYELAFKDDGLIVKVKVVGIIRPIKYANVEFKSHILRNGLTSKFRSSEFQSGDDLFISFKSPQSGYLAIYLMDKNRDVYCLLPYQYARLPIFEVEHGKEYILFSKKTSLQPSVVDEYVLSADNGMETNQIYLIFSPNPFIKTTDSSKDKQLPRMLSYDQFQTWLSTSRRNDTEMQVHIEDITIGNEL